MFPLCWDEWEWGEELPWTVQQGLSSVLVQCCGMWAASLGCGLSKGGHQPLEMVPWELCSKILEVTISLSEAGMFFVVQWAAGG